MRLKLEQTYSLPGSYAIFSKVGLALQTYDTHDTPTPFDF